MRTATRWLAAAAVLAAVTATATAGKYNKSLDVGDKAPAFAGLRSVDGKSYALGEFEGKDAVVLVFTSNHCPVAQAYNERFNAFVTSHGDKVGFLAISVSKDSSDSLDEMKTFAEREGLKFAYASDPSQKTGRDYGATVTPHVFVLDKERNVAYMGAWDDAWQNPEKVKHAYAREAVEAVLSGKKPETAETQQFGCGIRYE